MPVHPYFDIPRPHLFAHRGASGEVPENTRLAFERALAQGVVYLEMDCHASADGEIVIHHDETLERTTDASGPIRALSFAELEKVDAGHGFSPDGGRSFPFRRQGLRVPRLAEVLAAFPEARINLELKQAEPPIAEEVVRLIHRAGAERRMLLAAEDEAILARVRELDPGTALGSSLADVVAFVRAGAEGRLGELRPRGHALQVPPDALGRPLVTAEFVAAAHALGLAVDVWTINEPREMRRLLALGVDGVMSDFPARLVAASR
ncbi:MAG TPA: glycerophosphodiester phosphodiesterase [Myxococcota bacterium]|nr:glycerophosphodiester phosphodiesterase [Myxococcota bacterium]